MEGHSLLRLMQYDTQAFGWEGAALPQTSLQTLSQAPAYSTLSHILMFSESVL